MQTFRVSVFSSFLYLFVCLFPVFPVFAWFLLGFPLAGNVCAYFVVQKLTFASKGLLFQSPNLIFSFQNRFLHPNINFSSNK